MTEPGTVDRTSNAHVADRLREMAELLRQQGGNPYRVSAYRHAADTVDRLGRDVGALLEREGLEGLRALDGVGRGIAGAIRELLTTGRWSQLDRLRGGLEPARLFQVVPGIGPKLAERIHDHLEIDTLEELERAAHDGRLERVPGVGRRRAAGVRASLATMLSRGPRRRPGSAGRGRAAGREAPPVAVVLAVDRDYRRRAEAGKLPTIAPRRFNPEGRAWLPILHADRDGWHFTALYSNTARAHELGRTRDWVVLYFYDRDRSEGQQTVVTESRGPLRGRRVVRGREEECRRHYAASDGSARTTGATEVSP